jgi:hypothetical protein
MIGKFLRDKRGEELLFNTVIFIVLNTVFFAVLIIFIWRASSGAILQEQAYAKEIALLLDSAKPEMSITLDMTKAINMARTNKDIKSTTLDSDVLRGIVNINNDKKEVSVSFTKSGNYIFRYFSDYNVTMKTQGVFLMIDVKEKGAANAKI